MGIHNQIFKMNTITLLSTLLISVSALPKDHDSIVDSLAEIDAKLPAISSCSCENGWPLRDASCTPEIQMCFACKDGFELDRNSCIAKREMHGLVDAKCYPPEQTLAWKYLDHGNGVWYALGQQRVKFNEAMHACRAHGGQLASIIDTVENKFVVHMAKTFTEGVYVGGMLFGSEDDWYWNEGGAQGDLLSQVVWKNFYPGQGPHLRRPRDQHENCIMVNWPGVSTTSETWVDHYCDEVHPFMCQFRCT